MTFGFERELTERMTAARFIASRAEGFEQAAGLFSDLFNARLTAGERQELVGMLGEDAEALGCTTEIAHARRIAAGGTSADRQVACFQALIGRGASREEALRGVVDHLIAETVAAPEQGTYAAGR